MLAYGQRYVAITGRIRQLVSDWSTILVPIPSVCARSKFFDAAWG